MIVEVPMEQRERDALIWQYRYLERLFNGCKMPEQVKQSIFATRRVVAKFDNPDVWHQEEE